MKLSLGFGIILTSALLVACQSEKVQKPEQVQQKLEVSADASRIKSHLRFLSDDLLEGRDTGARGHEIASLYIAAEFAKYGLKPAGDDDTYMQRVSFVQANIEQPSIKLSLTGSQGEMAIIYPKQFLTSPNPVE
jgi:hypothetical protein